MPNLKSATRFLNEAYARRLLPAGRLLKERLVVRPLQFAGPYLKKGFVVRPLLFSFIVIGAVLMFLGVREYRRSSPASASSAAAATAASSATASKSARTGPQEITCRELAATPSVGNAHVRLTEFEFTDHYLPRKAAGGSTWQTAYVPAVPVRVKDSPAVRPLKVLVKTSAARNQRELYALSGSPIEGTIVKGIASLASDEQALLRKSYPHIDLDACWIMEAGRVPQATAGAGSAANDASASAASNVSTGGARSGFGKIGGGAGLAIIAAGVLLLGGRRS